MALCDFLLSGRGHKTTSCPPASILVGINGTQQYGSGCGTCLSRLDSMKLQSEYLALRQLEQGGPVMEASHLMRRT